MMPANKRQLRGRAPVMFCCWLAYVVVLLLRNNLPVALPFIEAEYGTSRATLGLLSSAFLWIYGFGQLVNGYLGDRISAKWFMMTGLGVAAAANMGFALSGDFRLMMLCWGLNGYFQSMLWGPILKTITNWYEPGESGPATIAVNTSAAIGALASIGLSGALAGQSNWRNLFFIPALIAVAYLVLHAFAFKDRPPQGAQGTNARAEVPKVPMNSILRRASMRWITVGSFCQGIVLNGISLWAAMFFIEAYGLDIKRAVLYMLLIPMANFVGMLGVGWLHKKYNTKVERLAALTFLMGALTMTALLFLWSAGAAVAMILLALASAAMCAANTLVLGVYPLFFASSGRVSGVTGFLEFSAYIAAGCTAVLSGLLLDHLGWQSVIVLWLGVALIGSAALMLSERARLKEAHSSFSSGTD